MLKDIHAGFRGGISQSDCRRPDVHQLADALRSHPCIVFVEMAVVGSLRSLRAETRTRTAALELAPAGIRVNAVCPSPIDTAMVQALETGASPANPAAFHERMAGTIPLRRYGQPEEVAALVAFLCFFFYV